MKRYNLLLLLPLAAMVSCTEPRIFSDEELPMLAAPYATPIVGGCHMDEPPGVSEKRKAECRRALAQARKTKNETARYEWECKAWMAYPTPGCCDIPGADTPNFDRYNAEHPRIQAKYAKLMEERAVKEDDLPSLFAFCEFDIEGVGAKEKDLRRRQEELRPRYLEKREEFRRAAMAMLLPRLATLPELQGVDAQTLAAAPCTINKDSGHWDDCSSFDFCLRMESMGKDTTMSISGTVYGGDYPKDVRCDRVRTTLARNNRAEQHRYGWENGAWKEYTSADDTKGSFAAKRALLEEREGKRLLTVYDDRTGDIAETFVLSGGKDVARRGTPLPLILHHVHGVAYRLAGEKQHYCSLTQAEE